MTPVDISPPMPGPCKKNRPASALGSAEVIAALREIQLQSQRSVQSVDKAISALSAENWDRDCPPTSAVFNSDSCSNGRCGSPRDISPRPQLRSPSPVDVDARENTDSFCPDDADATPPSETERFVAAVTVEFTFQRLDYERVAMSCAVWVGLNQRVQEVVAEHLEVPPGVVDVHLLPGASHADSGVLAKSVIRFDSDLDMAEELRARAMRSSREFLRSANVRAAAVPGVRAAGAEATGPCGAADLGVRGLRVTVTREEIEEDLQIYDDDDSSSQGESHAGSATAAAPAPGGLEIVGRPCSRPPSAYPGAAMSRPPSAYTSKPLSRPASAFISESVARPSSARLRQPVEPVCTEDPVYTSSVKPKAMAEDLGDLSTSQGTSSTQSSPGAASSLLNTGGVGSDVDISEDANVEIEPTAAEAKPLNATSQAPRVCLAESARIAERFGIALLEKRSQAIDTEWVEATNMNEVLRAANELLRQELEEVMAEAGYADSDWSSGEDEDSRDDSDGCFWGSPVTTPREMELR